MDDEERVLSAARFVEDGLRWVLQAARRDLAAFSSEMAALMVGTEEDAMSDML